METELSHQPCEKACSSTHVASSSPLECNICFEDSFEPVVTHCGHVYCWICMYKWLKTKEGNNYCPVCNAVTCVDKLIPIYSKNEGPSSRKHDESVPKRIQAQREERIRAGQNGFNYVHSAATRRTRIIVALIPICIVIILLLITGSVGTSIYDISSFFGDETDESDDLELLIGLLSTFACFGFILTKIIRRR